MLAMNTWELRLLPPGKKAIPCKWVFKRKLNVDGSIERYKARLVVKGFHQQLGVDYNLVFAPVVRASTVRLFFSIVAAEDLQCHAIDIKNAFVQGDLEEDIFMKQPPGLEDGTDNVCFLNKSLYGLKQAPRVWNHKLSDFIISIGFVRSLSDGALFIQNSQALGTVFLLVYVDDIQIAAKQLSSVMAVKQSLLSKFTGKDLHESKFFLQMLIQRDRKNKLVYLRQQRHIEKLIDTTGLQDAYPISTPMIVNVHRDPPGAVIQKASAITQYKSIVGALLHIAQFTRPDISFAVSYLARFQASPTTSNFARLRDVLLYLSGTASYSLRLGGNCCLQGFVDSDYAGCTVSRKSTTGIVVKFGSGSIAWKSSKQPTVSRSSTEAEYIAAGEIAKELQYLIQVVPQFNIEASCVPVGIDNFAAKCLVEDPISAARTKHIEIIYHHVREKVKRQQLKFVSVPTAENPADVFTKPLPRERFQQHRETIGVVP